MKKKKYWDVLISLKPINGICLSPFSERNKYQTPVLPRRWINKILGNKSQSMWQSLNWSKFWLIRSACCCFGFNQSPKQSTRIPVLLNFNDDKRETIAVETDVNRSIMWDFEFCCIVSSPFITVPLPSPVGNVKENVFSETVIRDTAGR